MERTGQRGQSPPSRHHSAVHAGHHLDHLPSIPLTLQALNPTRSHQNSFCALEKNELRCQNSRAQMLTVATGWVPQATHLCLSFLMYKVSHGHRVRIQCHQTRKGV